MKQNNNFLNKISTHSTLSFFSNQRSNTEISEVHHKKLTHGLKTYQDIKDAHLKNFHVEPNKNKENVECTFVPKVNNAKSKRSLNKFLKDQ
jgi:hypothetical protein